MDFSEFSCRACIDFAMATMASDPTLPSPGALDVDVCSRHASLSHVMSMADPW